MAGKKKKQPEVSKPKRRKLKADVAIKVDHVPELADARYKMYRAKLVATNGMVGQIPIGSFLATDEKNALAKARAAVRAAIL